MSNTVEQQKEYYNQIKDKLLTVEQKKKIGLKKDDLDQVTGTRLYKERNDICGEIHPDFKDAICRLQKDHHGFCEAEITAYLPIQKELSKATIVKKTVKWVGC